MRQIIPIVFFLMYFSSAWGKTHFPNVEYEYVRLYLFNTKLKTKEKPSNHIYKDGVYAKSKIGDGVVVPQNKVNLLDKLLSGNVNTLLVGLSKCFTPRHGFIYFNENHEPVASVSVCFECGMINMWSKKRKKSPIDYEKLAVKQAEKQLKYLKENIVEGLLPVFSERKRYIEYMQKQDNYQNIGEITVEQDPVRGFVEVLHVDDIKTWGKYPDNFVVDKNVEFAGGGKKYEFKELIYINDSKFLFTDNSENPTLAEAKIVSPSLTLPNGIKIGMSLEQVLATLTNYKEFSNPKIIHLKSKILDINYYFENHTLIRIKLEAHL